MNASSSSSESLQDIATRLSVEYGASFEDAQVWVLALHDEHGALLSVTSSPACVHDLPGNTFAIGETKYDTQPLFTLAESIVQDELDDAELSNYTILFDGPAALSSQQGTIHVVIGCQISTEMDHIADWLPEREIHEPNFSNHVLSAQGSKKFRHLLSEWKPLNGSFRTTTGDSISTSQALVRAPPSHSTVPPHVRRPNGFSYSKKASASTPNTGGGWIEELGDAEYAPKERYSLPAKKVGGRRFVHKQIRRKGVKSTSTSTSKLLDAAVKAFRALPRVVGGAPQKNEWRGRRL